MHSPHKRSRRVPLASRVLMQDPLDPIPMMMVSPTLHASCSFDFRELEMQDAITVLSIAPYVSLFLRHLTASVVSAITSAPSRDTEHSISVLCRSPNSITMR